MKVATSTDIIEPKSPSKSLQNAALPKPVCVEMKRAKKSLSRVSDEQIDWIDTINRYGYANAKVCYGAGEAIDFVSSELKVK